MPIRPENILRYPPDWPEISLAIKERAGWRCECEGECGRGTHPGRCPNVHEGDAYGTGSIVWLCHLPWTSFRREFGSHLSRFCMINVDEN